MIVLIVCLLASLVPRKVLWYTRRTVLPTVTRTISSMTRTTRPTAWVAPPKFWELPQGFYEASTRRNCSHLNAPRADIVATPAINCGSRRGLVNWSTTVPPSMRRAASSSLKINSLRPTPSTPNFTAALPTVALLLVTMLSPPTTLLDHRVEAGSGFPCRKHFLPTSELALSPLPARVKRRDVRSRRNLSEATIGYDH